MSSTLRRNKIKGISFKRVSYAIGKTNNVKNNNNIFFEDIKHLLSIDLPNVLTRADINKLLRDRGRQYLHSLVSEAVDKCSYWNQIVTTLQDKTSLLEEVLDVNYMFFSWKHRLSILEMIARGQHSYELEQQQWTSRRH